mgnify:CR=1 FL=1
MNRYEKSTRHAFYKRWRLTAVAIFSGLSAAGAGVSQIEPGTVNPWQVVTGVGAFVAIWIVLYRFTTRKP